MRFFTPDDMREGLFILIAARRMTYRVDRIHDGQVSYSVFRGDEKEGRMNQMAIETFVTGMEEQFGLVDDTPKEPT